MRALSLWQPWATAMRLELKGAETRSWAAPSTFPAGSPLAIHAAKRVDTSALVALSCDLAGLAFVDALPRGALLGVVRVLRVERMTPELIAAQSPRERRWGDWSPGRFAWFTEPVKWFDEPIPCAGHQGLFHVVGEAATRLRALGLDSSPPPAAALDLFPAVDGTATGSARA